MKFKYINMTLFIATLSACSQITPTTMNNDYQQYLAIQTEGVIPTEGMKPEPRNKEYDWMSIAEWNKQFDEDKTIAAKGDVDVLFVGDSITAGWDKTIWDKEIAPLNAENFGIGGDHTGNVLWRLQHLTVNNLSPKVIVLQIGVNNFGHLEETPNEVFYGIRAVVAQLKLIFPKSKILLNAVFPFEQSATSPRRNDVAILNQSLAKLDQWEDVHYRNYGHVILEKDGSISDQILGDYLHPTPKAYQLWINEMLPDIKALLTQ